MILSHEVVSNFKIKILIPNLQHRNFYPDLFSYIYLQLRNSISTQWSLNQCQNFCQIDLPCSENIFIRYEYYLHNAPLTKYISDSYHLIHLSFTPAYIYPRGLESRFVNAVSIPNFGSQFRWSMFNSLQTSMNIFFPTPAFFLLHKRSLSNRLNSSAKSIICLGFTSSICVEIQKNPLVPFKKGFFFSFSYSLVKTPQLAFRIEIISVNRYK